MNLIAFYTENGVPKTGLSPSIDAYDIDTLALVVDGETMSEVGGGFYKYDYTGYDETKDYGIVADGGATLVDVDRYVYGTSQTMGLTETTAEGISDKVWDEITAEHILNGSTGLALRNVYKIAKNKWKIENNQMIIYDDDESTPLFTFDLKNNLGNPAESSVYERDPV